MFFQKKSAIVKLLCQVCQEVHLITGQRVMLLCSCDRAWREIIAAYRWVYGQITCAGTGHQLQYLAPSFIG